MNSKFGQRIQKISVDVGFTCPNRDGTKGKGGCVFCNNEAFVPFYANRIKLVDEQISTGINFFSKKYSTDKFILYFQAYTSTYKNFDFLENIISEQIKRKEIVGIAIATRPDCVNTSMLNYFEEFARHNFLEIEYGVETFNNKILELINRGHSAEESIKTIRKSIGRGFLVGAHLILGLPNETEESMLKNATILNNLKIDFLKLHHLQVIKDTKLEKMLYQQKEINLFSQEAYLEIVCKFIEKLSPEIMIDRLINEVPPRFLIAPKWGGLRAGDFQIKLIEKMMALKTFQGKNI